LDPDVKVVVRTRHHPAAIQLAELREVEFCDDLYETSETFEDVYAAIAGRVIGESRSGHVIYAVPGSPLVGEFAVRKILEMQENVELIPAESFVDAVLAHVGYDPLDRGLQILNGHELPDPLVLDKPTIIAHLDSPEALADVCASLDRVMDDTAEVTLFVGLGSADAVVVRSPATQIEPSLAGFRTSLFVDEGPGGLIGVVNTMRLLRAECPWDREQTHGSLIKNLVEETYELIDAIERLDDSETDWVGYAEVEDELGDLLLQVLFHETIARESGGFDIDDVAETLRRKLVRRHPHVFGGVEVADAAEVKANWDRIKSEERQVEGEESVLDGVPVGMPGLHRSAKIQNRAAKLGFDWEKADQVVPKIREELDELSLEMKINGDVEAELGDLLFSVVNLARHLGVDAEVAIDGATRRFERRFREMERSGPLDDLDLDQLNERWERAKRSS
jgi:tetrapyrrole methylase family protein/MazG family protein